MFLFDNHANMPHPEGELDLRESDRRDCRDWSEGSHSLFQDNSTSLQSSHFNPQNVKPGSHAIPTADLKKLTNVDLLLSRTETHTFPGLEAKRLYLCFLDLLPNLHLKTDTWSLFHISKVAAQTNTTSSCKMSLSRGLAIQALEKSPKGLILASNN